MKLIAGELNGERLINLVTHHTDECVRVRAAIAYAHHDNLALFEECKKQSKPLHFYGRYDGRVPITPEVLDWFLAENSPNLVCRLVPDILHSKVIWWEGRGAYIGSANLTSRAWYSNIEAGLFVPQDQLEDAGVDDQLEFFFDTVHEKSRPLTREVAAEQRKLLYELRSKVWPAESDISNEFAKHRLLPVVPGLASVDRVKGVTRERNRFLEEWNETLELMRQIAQTVSKPENRPSWVRGDVPIGVQADQFLHLFYYIQVREGLAQPFEKHHANNRADPARAMSDAVNWWRDGSYEHRYEENTMYNWAPRLRTLLARDRILSLTVEEFIELVGMVHATRDYAIKQENALLGIPKEHADREEKLDAFGRLLFSTRSASGAGALSTINYVLYGGAQKDLPSRLYEATHDPRWRVERLGISTLGELVGWALPDDFPPRNGRSSKALRALGNDVKVYSV